MATLRSILRRLARYPGRKVRGSGGATLAEFNRAQARYPASGIVFDGAPVAPSIAAQPLSASVTAGSPVTFSISATGTGPLAYQWQRNGANIGGATAASYTLAAPVLGDTGAAFRCVVTGAVAPPATSSAAILTVTAAPISTNPRFGYAVALQAGNTSGMDTLFASMANLAGSANAGRAGTFSTVSSTTNYTWVAVLASAAGASVRFFDGVGFGGFSGAGAPANYTPGEIDPSTNFLAYTDTSGNAWKLFRSDGKAITYSTFTLS